MANIAQAMTYYAALECVESYTERKRILDLCRVFELIREENGNGGKILELFAKYQRMYGLKGLKRKYYVWLEAEEKSAGGGALALADGRRMKRPERDNPFLRDFKNYCERNKNSGGCRAALDDMMRDFRRGDVAFSFGTWRRGGGETCAACNSLASRAASGRGLPVGRRVAQHRRVRAGHQGRVPAA